jgi:two-component system sensor histidine kinase PilS (NtrC family)
VTVAVRRDGAQGLPVVEVIDRGPGIPPRVVEQIFTAFFTTSDHGTGLGLYIARQLCDANQSMLSYEAVPGGGSCFRIVLPMPQLLSEGLHR